MLTSGTAATESDISGELRQFRSGIATWVKGYGAARRLPPVSPTVDGAAAASLQGWSRGYFGTHAPAACGCPANDHA